MTDDRWQTLADEMSNAFACHVTEADLRHIAEVWQPPLPPGLVAAIEARCGELTLP